MAIMVAGGVTFAFPPAIPAMAQQSNPNLSVSAESSTFNNYFAGAQVVEIVIIDPDIDETNEAKGEPDVTINSNKLRMVQATDGKWYGYVADIDHALVADATVTTETRPDKDGAAVTVTTASVGSAGKGLDFGTICTPSQAEGVFQEALGDRNVGYFSDAIAVAFPFYKADIVVASGARTSTTPQATSCAAGADVTQAFADVPTADATHNVGTTALNVVREPKAINNGQKFGQSIEEATQANAVAVAGIWPFVQLYDFNPTGNVVVQYNRGGGTQSVTLNYDEVDDLSSLSLDRSTYPRGAEVHFTVTDTWLDIDPTDQDSWTWDVVDASDDTAERAGSSAVYYLAFDENGASQGTNVPDVSGSLGDLACADCRLELNVDAQSTGTPVVALDANNDSVPTWPSGDPARQLLTVTETGATTGTFTSYDESDDSALVATGSASRDTTATITYDTTPQSISVGHATATIDIQPSGDAWLSGQEIPVVLTDADLNRNTRADEDLDVLNTDHIIPALVTGSPATIANARYVAFDSGIPGDLVGTEAPAEGKQYTAGVLSASGVGSGPSRATVDNYDPPALRSTIQGTLDQAGRAFIVDYGGPAGLGPSATSTAVINFDFSQVAFESGVAAADRDFDVWALSRASGGLVIAGGTNADLYGTTYLIASDTVSGTYVLPAAAHVTAPTGFGLMIMANGNVEGRFPAVTAFADVMTFGFSDDGVEAGERIANQVIRLELEETADNTGVFEGTLEYVMV
ncbi:MAG: hypothetical protein OXU53_08575, partial [Deltaproteobacteria bacterium]|nr:hypothetical protein [Deltaproteobacteria bacterium]